MTNKIRLGLIGVGKWGMNYVKTIENIVDYGRLNPYNIIMKSNITRGISHLNVSFGPQGICM